MTLVHCFQARDGGSFKQQSLLLPLPSWDALALLNPARKNRLWYVPYLVFCYAIHGFLDQGDACYCFCSHGVLWLVLGQ